MNFEEIMSKISLSKKCNMIPLMRFLIKIIEMESSMVDIQGWGNRNYCLMDIGFLFYKIKSVIKMVDSEKHDSVWDLPWTLPLKLEKTVQLQSNRQQITFSLVHRHIWEIWKWVNLVTKGGRKGGEWDDAGDRYCGRSLELPARHGEEELGGEASNSLAWVISKFHVVEPSNQGRDHIQKGNICVLATTITSQKAES